MIGTVVGGIGGVAKVWVKKSLDSFFNPNPKGCYITTAVCEEYGKPDDCYELTSFRAFRDQWLQYQPDGKELIDRYYKTAPQVVDLINEQPDCKNIYHYLNDTYLSRCLSYIESGENEKCKSLYIEMMEYLYGEQEKWLS